MEELYQLKKQDIPQAGELLAGAFRDDPLWSKVFEGVADQERKLKAFFEIPVRFCRIYGEAYASSPGLEGVAAWVPGKTADMTVWRLLRSGGLGPGMKLGADFSKRIQPISDPLEKDRRSHMQGRGYIYLQIIGVAPKYQGDGYGGKMLRYLIARTEESGLPLYLETQTETNVRMYEHFGFRTVKELVLPMIEVLTWEMVREPG